MPAAEYCFRGCRLLPDQRMLLVDGERAKLGGRAFDLLLALLEQRERTVSRDELFERVWPGRIVEDQNLKAQIHALRNTIGRDAIATVPGRGYRFALPLDGDVPAAAPAAPQPQPDLPADYAPLLGRGADVDVLLRLLSQHRLVTVAGPAGIGKTRIVQAVAQQLRSAFADGVGWVELAPLGNAALLPATVLRALGFVPGAEQGSADGTARALASLSLLLALDNCEHLAAAVGELCSALLRAAPRVTLLATSQQPLHVAGEQVFRLGALALPAGVPAVEQALEYGAVALFAERARAVDPRFAIERDNVAAVVEVCRRLDGIPLAIELAAARVPLLGVEGVRARLDERLRLLTGGAHSGPARHRTLHAALDWSHGLLSPDAQAVLRRVGVFAGAFSLPAAQEVAADESIDDWAALDALGELVDKSLVIADGRDAPRYRLLESARAYALAALARSGETVAVRRRHAAALAALFDAADARYGRGPSTAWLGELTPELDNWREAQLFSLGSGGDPAAALALAVSAVQFLAMLGLGHEAAQALQHVQPLLAGASPLWQARWHAARATLGLRGAIAVADGHEAALRAADGLRRAGDAPRLYRVLNLLTQYAELSGDLAITDAAVDEMQRIESPDWPALFTVLRRQNLAQRHRRAGRLAEYRDGFAAEAELCARAGDERTASVLRCQVAMAELMLGDRAAAACVAAGVADAIRRHGLQRALWQQLAVVARVMVEQDDPGAALPALREAVAVLRPQGALWWLGDHLACLVAQRGDWPNAARLHGWVEARTAEQRAPRGPVIKEARDQLRVRLQSDFAGPLLQQLLDEGAALDEQRVVELVLGDGRDGPVATAAAAAPGPPASAPYGA